MRRLKGPVLAADRGAIVTVAGPDGSFIDPRFEQGNLRGVERFALFARRHYRVRFGPGNMSVKRTFFAVVRNNDSTGVATEHGA